MNNLNYIEVLYTCALSGCSKDAQAILALRELRDFAVNSYKTLEEVTVGVGAAVVKGYLHMPERNSDLFVINGGKK